MTAAEERLLQNLAEILVVERSTLSMATRAEDVPSWDSTAVIEVVFMLQREYDVTLEMDESTGLTSVQAIVDVLRTAGKWE